MNLRLGFVNVALALAVQVAARPMYEITIRHTCDSAEAPVLNPTDSDFAISFTADDQTSLQQPLGELAHATQTTALTHAMQTTAPWQVSVAHDCMELCLTVCRALARIAQPPSLTGMDTAVPTPKRATSLDWSFPYDTDWGNGVWVYVVDSGVRADHVELKGRVDKGHVIPGLTGLATEDVCDHGTGVASIIAGNTLGIARSAYIVPIRIADSTTCVRGPKTNAYVLEGIKLALSDFQTRRPPVGIINISWQVYDTPEIEQALRAAITAGLHVVVSAGNEAMNQCFGGPSAPANQRVKDVGQIVVGNIDWTDTRAPLSNFGDCLTLFAPGTSLKMAGKASPSAYITETGTSFSAPLVAGTIASLVASKKLPPREMRDFLVSESIHGAGIKGLGAGSPDILLQTLYRNAKRQ
ncbi:peptidase S8/S53 domain-containing protein [Mycena latifolia]|nr:peptidase S8/S53 domain-containing protein [Mycena latifolia]